MHQFNSAAFVTEIHKAHLQALDKGVVSNWVVCEPLGVPDLIAEGILGHNTATSSSGAAGMEMNQLKNFER